MFFEGGGGGAAVEAAPPLLSPPLEHVLPQNLPQDLAQGAGDGEGLDEVQLGPRTSWHEQGMRAEMLAYKAASSPLEPAASPSPARDSPAAPCWQGVLAGRGGQRGVWGG